MGIVEGFQFALLHFRFQLLHRSLAYVPLQIIP